MSATHEVKNTDWSIWCRHICNSMLDALPMVLLFLEIQVFQSLRQVVEMTCVELL